MMTKDNFFLGDKVMNLRTHEVGIVHGTTGVWVGVIFNNHFRFYPPHELAKIDFDLKVQCD